MKRWLPFFILLSFAFTTYNEPQTWIRINLLGYTPSGLKVAVCCTKESFSIDQWSLVDAKSGQVVFTAYQPKAFGAYGPFSNSWRLDFSSFKKTGKYYLQAGAIKSPEFIIADDVYKGAADFCLRYMRQQRSGFNPFLKDSCHTHDGYVLYGAKAGIKDSTHIDVTGGWHDASDYLQYVPTTATATYQLLSAYRDFPAVFRDEKLANGLDGKNGLPDVLDEARWGLDWLLKMHPQPDQLFNQLGDDRDHKGMRIPKEDTNYYGKGLERPVYFVDGEPQQRGRFMNNTTGTSSSAAKFSSAFALGSLQFYNRDSVYAKKLMERSFSSLNYAYKKPGVTQTVSVLSPYIYAEENWYDDMELANACQVPLLKQKFNNYKDESLISTPLHNAETFARLEPLTPWLGSDTAKHYQWYPFINMGHYELAKQLKGAKKDTIISFYKNGIELVWNKAKQNAFYRGIPFIWCSNNLTVNFAIQCYWYKQLSKDKSFDELQQANFDWIFGCNPWGSSFVYGLPANTDFPADPHSAFTHLKNYPIDGGLVDGPVYTSIYKNLIGIQLYQPDEYAAFQSNLAVYHDDYGDYSTNEPTMDGTASLIYLLAAREAEISLTRSQGAIIRGDSSKRKLAIVFTGDEFADGGNFILQTLEQQKQKASFFFTGRFYDNPGLSSLITKLKKQGHYLGPHSYGHLLYSDWNKRDSLLVSKTEFESDMQKNYTAMRKFGVENEQNFFIPPYEWWSDSISAWCVQNNIRIFSFTPGTRSNADYTWPSLKAYQSSEAIYNSITAYEKSKPGGLNGFILLLHIGTDPRRTDKFYRRLPSLLNYLKQHHYELVKIDELLN